MLKGRRRSMDTTDYDAVVIGSGPNGLAAAITLARCACSVLVLEANGVLGGGVRSAESTLPGFVHDLCSAIHPLALVSPFFATLPLERYGLAWLQPEISLAHPFDDGAAACLRHSIDETTAAFASDGEAYRRLMAPLVSEWEDVVAEVLQPLLHVPRKVGALTRFGVRAIWPATILAKTWFKTEQVRALFAGIAAHSLLPLEAVASAAFGVMLGMISHVAGWPLPRGGAQSLSNALGDYFNELGGKIETNARVRRLSDLPSARAILFDVTPWQFLQIAGEVLPGGYRRRLQKFKHAPAVFKIDYALSRPVPWKAEQCRGAGTVHLGGTLNEIANAEHAVASGNIPERPFVLVAQPSIFDRTRAPDNMHTLWTYCHLPYGATFDMSARIEGQIERFAPGFRSHVLARKVSGPGDLEKSNANLVGGDINGGASNLRQLIARPILSSVPYRTPLRGVYLCSSSTPPGGGVHGMCGYHAARAALRDLFI